MIRSWKGKLAEAVFQGRTPKGFPADLYGATRRKLARIDAAAVLEDLRSPPGNRLHALTDDRKGQWSIGVNGKRPVIYAALASGMAAQFQGRISVMRLMGWSAIRAVTSRSQASGSRPLSLAVSMRE